MAITRCIQVGVYSVQADWNTVALLTRLLTTAAEHSQNQTLHDQVNNGASLHRLLIRTQVCQPEVETARDAALTSDNLDQ